MEKDLPPILSPVLWQGTILIKYFFLIWKEMHSAVVIQNAMRLLCAKISSLPQITANHPDAALIHEAAIGKIAGEQIIKLMTLGLTEAEAEEQIISGFLK